jgi:MFS family permease
MALAVLPGLAGAGLVMLVRERAGAGNAAARTDSGSGGFQPPSPSAAFSAARMPPLQDVGTQPLPRPFLAFLAAWTPFALTNSSDVFILLRASQLGLSATAVVLLYTLYNLVYALASPGLGQLSDRVGRQAVLCGGLVLFAAVYAGFAVAHTPLQLAILFGIYGLYIAATDGVSKAYAIDLVPATAKAAATGWLGAVTGIGALAASSIAGVLWHHIAPWSVFAYGAAGALLTAGALVRTGPVPSARASKPRP